MIESCLLRLRTRRALGDREPVAAMCADRRQVIVSSSPVGHPHSSNGPLRRAKWTARQDHDPPRADRAGGSATARAHGRSRRPPMRRRRSIRTIGWRRSGNSAGKDALDAFLALVTMKSRLLRRAVRPPSEPRTLSHPEYGAPDGRLDPPSAGPVISFTTWHRWNKSPSSRQEGRHGQDGQESLRNVKPQSRV